MTRIDLKHSDALIDQEHMRVRPAYKIDFLVRAIHSQGISADQILAGTQLTEAQLPSPDARVTLADLVRVYKNVQQLSSDPILAIKVGKQINGACYGLYGHALLSHATLREGLIFSINYHGLVTRTVRMELKEEENDPLATLCFHDLLQEPTLERFNIEFQFGIVLALFRDMHGDPEIAFQSAHFAFPEPAEPRQYEALLDCPVHFNAAFNGYRFQKHWLDIAMPRSNPYGLKSILRACEEELKELCKGDGLLIAIRRFLLQGLQQQISADEIAQHLHISTRTLRRRLAERGTSLREQLNQVRVEAAKKYLSRDETSIEVIAEQLGYSDVTNFRHAFKREAGISPGDYRKSQQL